VRRHNKDKRGRTFRARQACQDVFTTLSVFLYTRGLAIVFTLFDAFQPILTRCNCAFKLHVVHPFPPSSNLSSPYMPETLSNSEKRSLCHYLQTTLSCVVFQIRWRCMLSFVCLLLHFKHRDHIYPMLNSSTSSRNLQVSNTLP
jgi:hypothetical protein